LVVPGLQKNLISISKLTCDFPVDAIFTNNSFLLQKRDTKEILAQGMCEHNLYILEQGQATFMTILNSNKLRGSFELWHSRLGHVNHDTISHLIKTGHLSLTSVLPNPSLCASCEQAKSKCVPFCLNEKRASHILDLVHCDLWGPAPVCSNFGFQYYVIFVDDYSRFTWLYPLHLKYEFYDIFVHFKSFVKNQFNTSIKAFQSDGGTEFTNNRM